MGGQMLIETLVTYVIHSFLILNQCFLRGVPSAYGSMAANLSIYMAER